MFVEGFQAHISEAMATGRDTLARTYSRARRVIPAVGGSLMLLGASVSVALAQENSGYIGAQPGYVENGFMLLGGDAGNDGNWVPTSIGSMQFPQAQVPGAPFSFPEAQVPNAPIR